MKRVSTPTAGAAAWKIRPDGVDVHGVGDRAILWRKCLGLICSVQCPGSIVIKTFDAIRELRDAGVVVVGGFHSPMEKECLEFLLRGEQPVIVVLAKGLSRPNLAGAWRAAFDAGQLLILSPFDDTVGRTTRTTAQKRVHCLARRCHPDPACVARRQGRGDCPNHPRMRQASVHVRRRGEPEPAPTWRAAV